MTAFEQNCVYCANRTKGNEPPEHPVPEALGSPFQLRPGDAHLECNQYVAKLDQALCDHPHIAGMIVATGLKGKNGRVRSRLLEGKSVNASLDAVTGSAEVRAPARTVRKAPDGGMHIGLPVSRTFNDWLFSRALHKVGLGMVAFRFGARVAVEPRFDEVRKYVRRPSTRGIWPYLQRMGDTRTFTRSGLQDRIVSQQFHFYVFLGQSLAIFCMNLVVDEFVVALYGDLSYLDDDDLAAVVAKVGIAPGYRNQGSWIVQPGARAFTESTRLVKPVALSL